MMDSIKLSVIVPLYNAGDAFIACMDSLLAQTYRNIEIIIINDGSSDHSPQIAQRYADNYAHITLIHQSNQGCSVARNRAMDIARGEYIAFVDADDVVYPDMYTVLMKMAIEDNLDVAQCNAVWCDVRTGHCSSAIPAVRLASTGVLSGAQWLRKALASYRWTHVVWMGIYRRALIERLNLQFIPGLYHEDIPWSTELLFNAQRVRYTQQPLYRYSLHDQSISRSSRSGEKHLIYQRHYIRITRLLEKLNEDYAGKITIYPQFRQQITREALRVCRSVRKETCEQTKQQIVSEILTSGTHWRMLRNARSLKLGYQALLWIVRLYIWRGMQGRERGIARARRLLSFK